MTITGRSVRRWRNATAALATITTAAGLLAVSSVTTTAAAAPAPARDGSSAALAAPSCWAIKQQNPSSTSGVYWLQTATLVDPEQFYCDQTTSGGGWVLVGRGRDGWTWNYNGQGSTAALRNTPSGTGAFTPATLPTQTITGLLDGGRVDALSDGIRLTRAKNSTGTQFQNVQITTSNRPNWSWSFGGGILFSQISFDAVAKGGGNTQSYTADQNFNALVTPSTAAHNYRMGFGFGSGIAGSNNSTSFLWSNTTERNALPFTQVWLRPKMTSSNFTAVPDSGLPASTVRPIMSSTTSPTTPWGVTGIYGSTSELHMEVEAFEQIGHTMYVGGDFLNVQKGANPTPDQKINQSFLAAFDVDTGEWVSSFRPVLNGEVWDLQALPNGELAVGGEFTSVNGQPGTGGIVSLNPVTGQIASDWHASVDFVNSSGTVLQVKALDVQDGWLYLAGRFNRISGGVSSPLNNVIVGRAARVRVSDGRPDGTWKPNFDGTVVDLDASAQGDRVYFAGYFDDVNGTASPREAAVGTASPAALVAGLQPWVPSIGSGTATYQQAIAEAPDGSVWQGGSEHILGHYDRNSYQLQQSFITKNGNAGGGGDIQVIGAVGDVVYASCHCGDYVYSNDLNYGNPIPNGTDVNNIRYIGAWDARTGQYLPQFYPTALDTRSGIGGWALDPDSNGCLWFGGDFTRGSWTGSEYQWLGGFGKYCPRDATAPSTPTKLSQSYSNSSNEVRLSWSPSTDASGAVTYEVLRDDRVIGTTTSTTFADSTATFPAKYWVRAKDSGDNRSATSNGVTASGPDTTAPSAPTGLTASAVNGVSVQLDWTAASDDTGVTGYVVVRNGTALPGTVTGTTYTDTGLTPGSSYTYTVRATDAAGNVGPDSSSAAASTPQSNPSLYSDSWSAADGTPWQSAWTTTASGGSATTTGNAGVLGTDDTSGAYSRAVLTGVPARTDSTLLTSFRWNSATALEYLNVTLRGSGGWQNAYRPKNGYGLQLQSNSGTVTVQKSVAGTTTNVRSVTGAQSVSTAKQWLRLQVSGTTIQFKIWTDGQAEPTAWSSVDTDSAVTAPGQAYISMVRGASNVGAKSVAFDDLRLLDA